MKNANMLDTIKSARQVLDEQKFFDQFKTSLDLSLYCEARKHAAARYMH